MTGTMMERREIEERLTGIFREVFDDESITLRDDLTAADVKDWDSFNHINLIVAVEGAFRIRFTTQEVNNMANVGEFIGLIARKLG